ncbi:MAG: methylenetetrahydrofolate reductase [NAD(P)H] [Crocinitomicaceae bacterium]|jgi:methylenetetrahydrofolate reductase (NADPH)|nr:methylenetetrahydrofolate reductase [NAD(P)H] [Crocinitomicaceae bacterium]|tara:strand:+ start:688 stop:1641 length:954 start_codon:yes stop_codon:yes gene_type:complete
MKVIDHINGSKKTRFSMEILPPLKGRSIQSIYDGIDPLMEFKPPFVNVTYHREEHVYKERHDGLLQKISVRKRPGTVGICAAIMNKYQVDAVPHIICGGFTKEETENALIDLQFLGIENILALRGDPIKNETHFIPNKAGHKYAVNLIEQVVQMNEGNFLHEETGNSTATNFCIGAAGYPEKHFESMNLKTDLKYLKDKVDAGAEFIVTQMFFDNQKYFDFVSACREKGIDVPIIPGLKPITTMKHITFLPKFFHIDFPEELSSELEKCKTNDDVRQVGIEWGIQQSKELVDYGVPLLHYYTMGKSQTVKAIASEIF